MSSWLRLVACCDGDRQLSRTSEHLNVCADIVSCVSHGPLSLSPSDLDESFARQVSDTMQALSTPSRVRILGRLHAGQCSVGELAAHVQMEASAVSQQLRVLRHLGMVSAERQGRNVVYELHDEHVAQLLEEAIGHVEHLHPGSSRRATETAGAAS